MPNPKLGTVTHERGRSGQRRQGRLGRVPRRKGRHRSGRHRQGHVHEDKLIENIRAFIGAVHKARPRRRQRQLYQPRDSLLDHGAGREGRTGKPVPDSENDALGLHPTDIVMPGLVPGIPICRAWLCNRNRDGRDKPGHDGGK